MMAQSRLPSGYREVEWIKGNGFCAIDIGIFLRSTSNAEVEFSYGENTGNVQAVLVQRNTASSTNFGGAFGFWFQYTNKQIGLNYGFVDAGYVKSNISPDKHIIKNIGKSFFLDGEIIYSYTNRDFVDGTFKAGLFSPQDGNQFVRRDRYFLGRVYRAQITTNGHMVRNFVPCVRKSDNAVGMYDLCGSICPLTNTPFYINAGTGAFTAGPPV